MFMRNNRAKNGAPQPESVASGDTAGQRRARKLSPNGPLANSPDDNRFTPQMSSCAAINKAHYQGGISGDGPYGTSYEQHIPYVGVTPVHDEGDRGLKG